MLSKKSKLIPTFIEVPNELFGGIAVKTGHNSVIMLSANDYAHGHIWCYNSFDNKWNKLSDDITNAPLECSTMSFDPITKILFVLDETQRLMHRFNIKNQQQLPTIDLSHTITPDYYNAEIVATDKSIHIISDDDHCTVNKNPPATVTKICDRIVFDASATTDEDRDFYPSSSVYLPSKQKLFLFGEGIRMFDIKTERWTMIYDKNEYKYNAPAVCATPDEKYIIIWSDRELFVLDNTESDTWKLRGCRINLVRPRILGINAIAVLEAKQPDNETVVDGYIRRLFETEKFEKVSRPPQELVDLIENFCKSERLYWFGKVRSGELHWSVSVEELLSFIF